MKTTAFLVPLGLLAAAPVLSGTAFAHEAAPSARKDAKGQDASIPFANHGGVDDWRAQGTDTVYFKDQHNHWYKATLMRSAFDLPYVENIGIISGAGGELDKFGGITVKGQRYRFASFEAVDGPPRHKKAKQGDASAHSSAS